LTRNDTATAGFAQEPREGLLRKNACSWPGRLKNGFALLELLIVMALAAVLAAMLVPTLSRAKSRAHQAVHRDGRNRLFLDWRLEFFRDPRTR
jgi:prepilin-type N-terminal cleavage/methylation domain-containing protein